MTRPKAILFDLDETLVSSELDGREAVWAETLDPHLHRLPGRTRDQIVRAVEAELRWFRSDPARDREGRLDMARTRVRIVQAALGRFGFHDPILAADLADGFHASRERRMRLFDDAHHVLDALKAAGVQLCLITNGESAVQRAKVERFDLGHRFHHIQIEGEHAFGKPEPAAYAHALQRLGAGPAEAWIVGDNLEWEVTVPLSLGFARAVWFDGHRRGLPSSAAVRPEHTASELRAVLAMIEA